MSASRGRLLPACGGSGRGSPRARCRARARAGAAGRSVRLGSRPRPAAGTGRGGGESRRNARAVPVGKARGKRGSDPASGLPTRGMSEAATLASRPESRLKIRALARKNLARRENAHHPWRHTMSTTPLALDEFDHRLLELLQRDADATLSALGDEVGPVGQRRAATHQALSRIGPDAPGRRAESGDARQHHAGDGAGGAGTRIGAPPRGVLRAHAQFDGSAAVLCARGRVGLPGDPRDHRAAAYARSGGAVVRQRRDAQAVRDAHGVRADQVGVAFADAAAVAQSAKKPNPPGPPDTGEAATPRVRAAAVAP